MTEEFYLRDEINELRRERESYFNTIGVILKQLGGEIAISHKTLTEYDYHSRIESFEDAVTNCIVFRLV